MNHSIFRNVLTVPLIILFIVSFGVRIYKLDQVPSSLYYDEVDLGYQARSLIETFKDYRGRQTPFYVLSFNDPRVPIPAYITTITTLLFNQEEYQVRMPGVILGTIITFLVFFLTRLWTGSILASFIIGLVFATNPWQIHNSRWPLEGIYSITFYLASIYFFFKAMKTYNFKHLLISVLFFSLTVYTYRTMSFMVPASMTALSVIYYKELWKFKLKNLLISVAVFLTIVVPFLYFTTIGAPDIPRIAQVSIFSNKLTPIEVQRNRELDSNDFGDGTIGKRANPISYIFHSKPLTIAHNFFNNYFQTFSTEFLFLKGAPSGRESIGEMGELFYIDVFALLTGLLFIVSRFRQKSYQFLIVLFLIAPIPTSLTTEGARHGSRLFIFSIPLLMIVGLGWWKIVELTMKLRYSKFILTTLGILWLIFFIFYLHRYFVHYPVQSAGEFGYGFKQAMLKINQVSGDYEKVYMSSRNDPPMIYYLFWSHTKPSDLQKYGSEFSLETNMNQPLDKFKAVNLSIDESQQENLGKSLQPGVLYLITGRDIRKEMKNADEVPKGVKVIDIIHYPNNTVAFYLFARDNSVIDEPFDSKYSILQQ